MMKSLDADFIRRAETITSFNFETKDLETLCYKREIQALFKKYFFPEFNLSRTLKTIDADRLNFIIDDLKSYNFDLFKKLHKYNLRGIGPGEVTLFFLVNTARLGGGHSDGVDIICNDSIYEVKSANISAKGIVQNFKLGGTLYLADIMVELADLREMYDIDGCDSEIKKSSMNKLRNVGGVAFEEIETEYSIRAQKYFEDRKVIIINNSLAYNKIGRIEMVLDPQDIDIRIERMTNGTIKPQLIPSHIKA